MVISLVLLVLFLTFSSVSAESVDDNNLTISDETYDVNEETLTTTIEEEEELADTTSDGTFTELNTLINDSSKVEFTLDKDYTFNNNSDSNFDNGILINRTITINGNGHTIDANNQTRIFKITGNNVILKNIIFKNGNSTTHSGAIHWNGDYGTLINCIFIQNKASGIGGAIYWQGSNAKISNSNFYDNFVYLSGTRGGAIYLDGFNATITNCIFKNNNATVGGGDGGALDIHESNAIISECKFYNNHANDVGSAMDIDANNVTVTKCYFEGNSLNSTNYATMNAGGAISIFAHAHKYNLQVIISECSFVNNYALKGAGAISLYENVNATIINCTFINNTGKVGGAISSRTSMDFYLTVNGCEFINNTATESGGAIYFTSNDLNVENASFVNNNANESGGAIYNSASKSIITNSEFSGNNANNDTGVFISGSNAIISDCKVDSTTAIVSNSNDTTISGNTFSTIYISNNGKGNGLKDTPSNWTYAIQNIGENGTIYFLEGTYKLAETTISKQISLIGYSGSIIDAENKRRIFEITADNVLINGLTFANGSSSNYGGALKWSGNKGILTNCTFSHNQVTQASHLQSGGAIYWNGINGTIFNCIFVNNIANGVSSRGGAVFIDGLNATIINCTFNNNNASISNGGDGGAVHVTKSNASIIDCRFYNNNAGDTGTVLTLDGTNITVMNCYFEGNNLNSITHGRGAISIFAHTHSSLGYINVTIANCSFINNYAKSLSSGICLYANVNATVINCSFINNTGPHGAIETRNNDNSLLNIIDCKFINNTGTESGAVYFISKGLYIENTLFEGNNATYGGALYITGTNGIIHNNIFINNHASGGSIYLNGYNNYINYNTFLNIVSQENNGINVLNSNNNLDYNWWGTNNGPNNTYFNSEDYVPTKWLKINSTMYISVDGQTALLNSEFLNYDKNSDSYENVQIELKRPVTYILSTGESLNGLSHENLIYSNNSIGIYPIAFFAVIDEELINIKFIETFICIENQTTIQGVESLNLTLKILDNFKNQLIIKNGKLQFIVLNHNKKQTTKNQKPP